MATLEDYERLYEACEGRKHTGNLTFTAAGIQHFREVKPAKQPKLGKEPPTYRGTYKDWHQRRGREFFAGLVKPLFQLASINSGLPVLPKWITKERATDGRIELLVELLGLEVNFGVEDEDPLTGTISWSAQGPISDYGACYQSRNYLFPRDVEKRWLYEVTEHLKTNDSPLARYFLDPPQQAAVVQAPQVNPVGGFAFNVVGADQWTNDQVHAPALTPAPSPQRQLPPAPQHQALQVKPVGKSIRRIDSAVDVVDLTGDEEVLTQSREQPVARFGNGYVARDQQFGVSQDMLASGSNQFGQQTWTDTLVHRPRMLAPSPQMATQQTQLVDTGAAQHFTGYGSNLPGQYNMWTGQFNRWTAPRVQEAHLPMMPQPMPPQEGLPVEIEANQGFVDVGGELEHFDLDVDLAGFPIDDFVIDGFDFQ